jgi:hypothetical protein
MTTVAVASALAALSGRRLGAVVIGPERDASGRPQLGFPDGGLRVELEGVSGEWLMVESALAITGRGCTLVWDLDAPGATRAVTARVAVEVGHRRARRVLARSYRQARAAEG